MNEELDAALNNNLQIIENLDYNVFNALNLISPALGENYKNSGFNPFEKDFAINEDFVEETINGKIESSKILSEDFLNGGNKKVSENFKEASANTDTLISRLEESLKDSTIDDKTKRELKKIIFKLILRSELLKIDAKKLKNKNVIAFDLYKELAVSDFEMNEIMKDSFTKKFNIEQSIFAFMKLSSDRGIKNITKSAIHKDLSKQKDILKSDEKINISFRDNTKIDVTEFTKPSTIKQESFTNSHKATKTPDAKKEESMENA